MPRGARHGTIVPVAKKTLIVDDLTGEQGARTRTLRFDGVEYEIDLTEASFADLRLALRPYLKAARVVGARQASAGPAPKRRRAAKSAAPSDAAVIRAWARTAGLPVTERGRVHPDLRRAWQAAGSPRA
mgnify:CR=1 FL=1